jgi:hypothetical protein
MRSVGPAVTRAAAIGTAVAAVAVVGFTAIVDYGGRASPTPSAPASPTRPVMPVPESTLPGSIDTPSPAPRVPAAKRKKWLRALAGTWTRDSKNTYFRFRPDGSGEWSAFGQHLWTGKATPRSATTFDLTDPDGRGGAYWQVTISGKKLVFAGTRQTFQKA